MAKEDISNHRNDYTQGRLDDLQLDSPFSLLDSWLKQAAEHAGKDYNAMVLSTVQKQMPDSRVVLLRGLDESGLVFYTNKKSKKGEDLKEHSNVALNFFWPSMERQVRVQGRVEHLNESMSTEYFESRPRTSKIGAWASNQSKEIASRELLEEQFENAKMRFSNSENIPKPEYWGGYKVVPIRFEFWQGRSGRMHDRICFELRLDDWRTVRLQP